MHTAVTHPLPRAGGRGAEDRTPPWWAPAVLPGRWSVAALAVVLGLVLLHLLGVLLRRDGAEFPVSELLLRLVDLNGERTLPAWFSTILLLLVAQASWLLAGTSAATGRGRWVGYERALAAIFVFLSIDELTSIHETTTTPLRTALGLGGILTYAWVVLYVPLVVVVGLVYLRWIRSLPVVAARLVYASGLLYVGGAAGVELVGAGLAAAGEKDSWAYTAAVVFEETGEMLGALLMLSVLTWLRLTRERRIPAPQSVAEWS